MSKRKINLTFFFFTNPLILVLCVRIKAASATEYLYLKPGFLAMSIYLEGLKPHGILSRRLLVILLSIWADILIHLSPGCRRYSNCTVLIRWIEWKSVGKCTFLSLIQSEWTSNCAFWKILVYLKYFFYCLFHVKYKIKRKYWKCFSV